MMEGDDKNGDHAGRAVHEVVAEVHPARREPGWFRVSQIDDMGRRALWARTPSGMTMSVPDARGLSTFTERIELCAGREGDDFYAVIERDNPAFVILDEALGYARYGSSWGSLGLYVQEVSRTMFYPSKNQDEIEMEQAYQRRLWTCLIESDQENIRRVLPQLVPSCESRGESDER